MFTFLSSLQVFAFLFFPFSDSPVSLTYNEHNSTVSGETGKEVRLTINAVAFPGKIKYQWWLEPFDTHLPPINVSGNSQFEVIVSESTLSSTLVIRGMFFELVGEYRVHVDNGIKSGRNYRFTAVLLSKQIYTTCLIIMYCIPS